MDVDARGTLLHDPAEAKERLVSARTAEDMVNAIMALGQKKPALMSALADCLCTDDTSKAIADRYSLHPSALGYWSRRLGFPKRRRGRRALRQPKPEHQRILDMVHEHGITETARQVGLSKQWVSQVVRRWEPQLRGRRTALKVLDRPRRRRRSPRNIVVSFRLSADEWQSLMATHATTDESSVSGFKKARAILLRHIGNPTSTVTKLATASNSPVNAKRQAPAGSC